MTNTRLQNFRSFLTERFTAVAVEIFGEVESIVEVYYEENKRLQNILHMVLNPEIKLPRIDVSQYTGATADVREQPPELKTQVDLGISEPLPKIPKEEQIDYNISWESEQQGLGEADYLITPTCIKNDPKEEEEEEGENSDMPGIADSYSINVVEMKSESSASLSADEVNDEHEDSSSLDSDAVTDCPQLSRSEESTSESLEPQNHTRSRKKLKHEIMRFSFLGWKSWKSKQCKQKTMLELPRMISYKSFVAAPFDTQSFLKKLTEAFKDYPNEEKPLITKMDLTADVELVDCAFGKVPKGCPLSYQCPVPSSQDYMPNEEAPPRPALPLSHYTLEPKSSFPVLSVKEQEHMDVMRITWEEAHSLELSTRERKELVEDLRKLRLTSRFREICKLSPGRSHAEHLLFKIQKGPPKCKAAQIEEELKTEALRVYCQNLGVNWYPCGLVVHPNAPWLGAQPDGLVYDSRETSNFGLVHVKCIMLRSFVECRFLQCQDGVLQLKKSHSYYWHIQAEMMVMGMSWCDLIVFSREDILVLRIYRDKAVIKSMKKKLDDFFFYYYLPSLF